MNSIDGSPQSKFNPDQPRVPAGQPGGGQWTSGTGAGGNDEDANDTAGGANLVPTAGKVESLRKFGKSTVRQFVARYCKGKINRELPGQFENMTIEDVFNLARGGDRAAKTCLKLLNREEYRK